MLLKKLSIFVMVLLLISGSLHAQISHCTLLGQNPETAFPVCGTAVFHQDTVPRCGGRQVATLCTDDILYTDKNPYWYKFTCFQSGKLSFFITPNTIYEDYDWQIFDITGKNPQDIYTDTSTFLVCSWSGVSGVTGACEDSGGVSLVECEGPARNRFTSLPDLVAGHNYLLLVSHFEDTQFGYSLSFGGPGNTAVITDTLPPHMNTATRATCDGSKILLKLNKRMKCSSLTANGSDFSISPPLASIVSAVGYGCSNAFDMDSILLTFSSPLPVGNYTLFAKNGTDGNTIWDLCDNGIPLNEAIPFTVLSPLPVPLERVSNNKCSTDSLIIVLQDNIKCSSVAANGSDFRVTGSYPVTITHALPLACTGGLTKQLAVYFSSNLSLPGNFQLILQKGTDGNTLLSECDTPSVAGQAIPFNILPKPVASFTFSDTVCLPEGKVVFANNSSITDGSEDALRYVWNFDDPASGGNNFSFLKSPTHVYSSTGPFHVKLQVISNGGCTKDSIITVTSVHPEPTANFGTSKKDVCVGQDAIFFTDSSNGMDGIIRQWNWDMGDGRLRNTKNVLHIYTAAKTYDVSLYTVNSFGCISAVKTRTVNVHAFPTADAGPDRKVLEGGTINMQATATGEELTYTWSPAQYLSSTAILAPKCEPKFDMLYTLTVTGKGGCAVSDNMFVDVLKIPRIPNTFSPNGDRTNELWVIQYLDEYPAAHLQLFTRAGQKVFESRGQYKAWDGTYKGKALPADTYYYILEPGSGREPFTGYVTIIR